MLTDSNMKKDLKKYKEGYWGIFNKIYFHALPDILFYKRLNTVKQEYFCYNWIKRHLEWSYKSVSNDDTYNYSVEEDQTIFVYWKQGWDKAPDIVKKCIGSVKANACNHSVILLDENNVKDYVQMPDYIECKHKDGHIKEALYSDLLRLSLLIKYGGCWIDATCFLSKPIPQYLFNSGFFMFSSSHLAGNLSPIEGSSWFIISSKNGGGHFIEKDSKFPLQLLQKEFSSNQLLYIPFNSFSSCS